MALEPTIQWGYVVHLDNAIELALKRFNRKIQNEGILSEARRRSHYETPQARMKRKAAMHYAAEA